MTKFSPIMKKNKNNSKEIKIKGVKNLHDFFSNNSKKNIIPKLKI